MTDYISSLMYLIMRMSILETELHRESIFSAISNFNLHLLGVLISAFTS